MAKSRKKIHLNSKDARNVVALFKKRGIHSFSQFDAQAMVLINRTVKATLYAVEKDGVIYVAQVARRSFSTDYQVDSFRHSFKDPTHAGSSQLEIHSFDHYDAKCMTLVESTVDAELYAIEKNGVICVAQVTRRSMYTDVQEKSFRHSFKPVPTHVGSSR